MSKLRVDEPPRIQGRRAPSAEFKEDRRARAARPIRLLFSRPEPLGYALFAGVCTLYAGCLFYSSLRLQTLYSRLWHDPAQLGVAALGEWSAPLDDVFIHFDFARSFARGFPFQWSEGNGYSSGGTSLLYPIVLAAGYWIGFRKLSLMVWAAELALVCVFAVCLAGRRLFRHMPRWSSYLLPPVFLCTGVLDWSLFSGMEVALFLAIWAGTLIAWDDLVSETDPKPLHAPSVRARTAILGAWGAALVAVRPEASSTLAVFALGAGLVLRRRIGVPGAVWTALAVLVPGVLVVLGQMLVNRLLTGDGSAAGARVKLELYHPYLTRQEVIGKWWFHLEYQIFRVTEYHLSSTGRLGWIAWGFSALALLSARTRRYALLLWASALLWLAVVALNGQVRWQNERYTMPAVAWLLMAAALGLGAALIYAGTLPRLRWRLAGALLVVAACALFVHGELPRFREQLWFFGRASRNILDQHVRVGRLLRERLHPHRVLVGDAGAIPYEADLPALDIIGLGGYHALPFARATQLNVGAGIELIEHIPKADRPDLLALYPSWWGEFPMWFGERFAEVPVRGNVICGGLSKVLYRANWQPLEDSERVFSARAGEHIVDSLDVADLVSEREHHYELSPGGMGHVIMKLLPHPAKRRLDLWDAGRIIAPSVNDAFDLSGFRSGRAARLVLRVAPAAPAAMNVAIADRPLGAVLFSPQDGWQEVSIDVPAERVTSRLHVRFETTRGERVVYHLWALQESDGGPPD